MARSKVRKAVIPAGGFGTRLLPVTKSVPKEMLPIIDTPAIHYVIEEVVESGITDILVISAPRKKAMEDYFDRSPELERYLESIQNSDALRLVRSISRTTKLHFVRQQEPAGLGHAVLCAQQHVGDEPFALLLPDEVFCATTPVLRQLLEYYKDIGSSVLAVRTVDHTDLQRYGVVSGTPIDVHSYMVHGLVEKPRPDAAPSNLAVLGRYVLEPSIFPILAHTLPGINGELQLTDSLHLLSQRSSVYAREIEGDRFDIGDKFGYFKATVAMALKRDDLHSSALRYLHDIFNQYTTGIRS